MRQKFSGTTELLIFRRNPSTNSLYIYDRKPMPFTASILQKNTSVTFRFTGYQGIVEGEEPVAEEFKVVFKPSGEVEWQTWLDNSQVRWEGLHWSGPAFEDQWIRFDLQTIDFQTIFIHTFWPKRPYPGCLYLRMHGEIAIARLDEVSTLTLRELFALYRPVEGEAAAK